MELIKTLWKGEVPLVRVFWLWFFLPSKVLAIALGTMHSVFGLDRVVLFLYEGVFFIYVSFIIVCVWKSATKYWDYYYVSPNPYLNRKKRWATLSKFVLIVSVGSYGSALMTTLLPTTGTIVYRGESYTGELVGNTPHGQGTLTGRDGSKYVGQFNNGELHYGLGTYTSADGEQYVGQFKDWTRHGQGTQTLPDGAKYVGEFKDGTRHGQGAYTWPDGNKYVGEWKNGEVHGQGTGTFADGGKYVGQHKAGKLWEGTTYDKDGNVIATWSQGVGKSVN